MDSYQDKSKLVIGVISDTHGLLRSEAVDALHGVDLIIHSGDIGRSFILDELGSIAPVIAVRGNMDTEGWAYELPLTDIVDLKNHTAYIIHDISRTDIDLSASFIDIVISGHSHRPSVKKKGGVFYVNPGSAGPRRFTLPVSVALLYINGKSVDARLISLKV